MVKPVAPLAELGRAVAEAQDRQLDRVQLSTQERLLAQPAARPGRRRARWAALSLAAAAAVALAVVLLQPDELTFTIGNETTPGQLKEWIAAPPNAPLPLRFSDGTSLELGPSSRTRVTGTTDSGAVLVVERGRIDAFVVPRSGNDWRLHFGPFEVQVTGTRFSASWDPGSERLTVDLAEGSLRVRGSALGPAGHALVAGNRLDASAADERFTITSTEPPAPDRDEPPTADDAPDEAPEAAEPGAAPEAGDDGGAPEASAVTPAARPVPLWRKLYEAGKYRQALAEAKSQGFEALCANASAAELEQLAAVARQGGEPILGARALTALRTRYAGSPQAAHAAFVLGQMAFDQRGAYGEAAQWFSVYLAEQPGGALAQEALVRLLEAKERAGDAAGARAAAEQYLKAYPSGPHAARARRVLAGKTDGKQPSDSK